LGNIDFQKTIRICLAWLGALCGVLAICLSDALPFTLDFIRPGSLLVVLVQVQVFFALLEILALPLLLVCSNIADAGVGPFLRGQALVMALALFTGLLFAAGGARGWKRLAPWYTLAVFGISAGLPFLAFLLREFTGADGSPLSAVSPFHGAAVQDSGVPLVQAVVLGGLALGLLFLEGRRRKGVDAPAPAR
jgi:hypothetical protein